MTDLEPPTAKQVATRDDIEVRLGADLVHLPIVRSVAANIAMRADFDLDAIADLRLAVDEACSTLITRAVSGATMVCRFTIGDDELTFTGIVPSADDSAPNTGSFGWRVLTTLADAASSWIEENSTNGQGCLVHIELSKRKPVNEG